jgi:energy-coupling factor transporter ATP-binding protein EcfA2
MDEKTKEEFLEIIKKLQETSKVIITSRHGHIVDTDIKKIELKALTTEQIDQYIQ